MSIRYSDHASFHRAAAGMVAGAAVTGIALHSVTSMAPLIGGIAGMAAGAAWAYGRPTLRFVAAALAIVPLVGMTMAWPDHVIQRTLGHVLAASVLALGLAAGGPKGVKGALAVGVTAFVALLGMWAAMKFSTAREMSKVPTLWLSGIAAAAMGMVGVLAVLPRHLRLASDPVKAAIGKLPANLDPEVKALCDRALAIWNTASDELRDEGGKTLLRDGVLKTLEVGAKSAEVKVSGPSDAELARRMTELDQKIAATSDEEAKTQYTAARAALDDQHRYREHIAKGRERLVARMHNHVAALEKFQLAASGLEAAKHANSGTMKQLEELSQNVTASGEALAEIEMGEAPLPRTAAGVIEVVEAGKSQTNAEPDAESGALA